MHFTSSHKHIFSDYLLQKIILKKWRKGKSSSIDSIKHVSANWVSYNTILYAAAEKQDLLSDYAVWDSIYNFILDSIPTAFTMKRCLSKFIGLYFSPAALI